ncbi:MAG: hypothetical protein DMG05_18495 [Acidobacteria bacterium]|nr:MAG: hypothetical protein DMG05_18495 [Acidobacteriota bacterium]
MLPEVSSKFKVQSSKIKARLFGVRWLDSAFLSGGLTPPLAVSQNFFQFKVLVVLVALVATVSSFC